LWVSVGCLLYELLTFRTPFTATRRWRWCTGTEEARNTSPGDGTPPDDTATTPASTAGGQ